MKQLTDKHTWFWGTTMGIILSLLVYFSAWMEHAKAQDFLNEVNKTRVTIYGGKRIVIETEYDKHGDKITSASKKELTPFDVDFEKYVKQRPVLSEKEKTRLLKQQEQKVLVWAKKHNIDIGVLTAKNTCKGEAVAWPIEKLNNKQITDLVERIFAQSDILCYLWDLNEPTSEKVKQK